MPSQGEHSSGLEKARSLGAKERLAIPKAAGRPINCGFFLQEQ
jgi:hypothetical protein